MINIVYFTLVGIGILFSLYRLIKGPNHFDRVVSLDVINVTIIGVLVVIALIAENEMFIDVAIAYGILGFLETIVFAKFLEVRS
jgi:multicomponent Na+:H+ antiporter subunit F